MDPRPPSFVLIVEDHRTTADVMARLVQARGFSVLTAASLAEARELARTNPIGFVISDIGLVDGDGCELMSELQAQYGIRGAAVTGFGWERDLERSQKAGFIMHLIKPIPVAKLDALLDLARRELGKSRWPGIH